MGLTVIVHNIHFTPYLRKELAWDKRKSAQYLDSQEIIFNASSLGVEADLTWQIAKHCSEYLWHKGLIDESHETSCSRIHSGRFTWAGRRLVPRILEIELFPYRFSIITKDKGRVGNLGSKIGVTIDGTWISSLEKVDNWYSITCWRISANSPLVSLGDSHNIIYK